MMLKIFLQSLILENVNGYLAEYTIHHSKVMNIFSITLIRLFILIVSTIKFRLCGILTRKYRNNAQSLFFMCMNFTIQETCFKGKTCFKNKRNPSFIDLLLTTSVYAFQQTITICTGLSDCRKIALTVLRLEFLEANQKKVLIEITKNLTFQNL